MLLKSDKVFILTKAGEGGIKPGEVRLPGGYTVRMVKAGALKDGDRVLCISDKGEATFETVNGVKVRHVACRDNGAFAISKGFYETPYMGVLQSMGDPVEGFRVNYETQFPHVGYFTYNELLAKCEDLVLLKLYHISKWCTNNNQPFEGKEFTYRNSSVVDEPGPEAFNLRMKSKRQVSEIKNSTPLMEYLGGTVPLKPGCDWGGCDWGRFDGYYVSHRRLGVDRLKERAAEVLTMLLIFSDIYHKEYPMSNFKDVGGVVREAYKALENEFPAEIYTSPHKDDPWYGTELLLRALIGLPGTHTTKGVGCEAYLEEEVELGTKHTVQFNNQHLVLGVHTNPQKQTLVLPIPTGA